MSSLLLAIRMEGWRRGVRWWLWARKGSAIRCPYCAGLSDEDWLAICDCFLAEARLSAANEPSPKGEA